MGILSLDELREEAGYTLQEVASICGVSEKQMKAYEASPGNMSASTAIKLRKLFKVPIDFLEIK